MNSVNSLILQNGRFIYFHQAKDKSEYYNLVNSLILLVLLIIRIYF